MSSPIAIPRASAADQASHSSTTASSTSSTTGLYVPVHKRNGASTSPASSRAPSPTPSWRSHSPTKTSRRGHKKSPSNSSAFKDIKSLSNTNIPITTSSIPKRNPFIYSIAELLELSSFAATLTPAQLESTKSIAALCKRPTPATPATPVTAAINTTNADKPASRRRRTGRRPTKNAQQTVVELRRVRNGHGTWGWQPHATPEEAKLHELALEDSWRHPVSIALTAQ